MNNILTFFVVITLLFTCQSREMINHNILTITSKANNQFPGWDSATPYAKYFVKYTLMDNWIGLRENRDYQLTSLELPTSIFSTTFHILSDT